MSIVHQSSEFHPCIKNSSNNQSVTLHLKMKVLTLFNNYEKYIGKKGSWVILSIRHLNASLWLGIKTSLWGLPENKGILERWLLLVLLATYEDRLSLRTVSLLNRPLRTLARQPSLIPFSGFFLTKSRFLVWNQPCLHPEAHYFLFILVINFISGEFPCYNDFLFLFIQIFHSTDLFLAIYKAHFYYFCLSCSTIYASFPIELLIAKQYTQKKKHKTVHSPSVSHFLT